MKPLPKITRKNGFTYTQVCRGIKSCVYAQGVSENIVYYEVFLIRIRPARHFKGQFIEEHERFPHNETFGLSAWTYRDRHEAMAKFNEIESS